MTPETTATAPVRLGRNGKPKPQKGGPKGKRATKHQFQERAEFVARMLSKPLRGEELRNAFIQKYGDMSDTQIQSYVCEARKILRKQSEMTPKQARELAINKMIDVMRTGKPSEVATILNQWIKIWGLEESVKVEHTGRNGGPIVTVEATCDVSKLSVEQLAVLRDALEAGRPEPKQIGDAKAE